MAKISFNGKFLTAGPTAVHLVAEEFILSVNEILMANPELAAELTCEVVTPNRDARALDIPAISTRNVGKSGWQFWEQIELPMHTRKSLLVNFCNLAPLWPKNAITMIHDAQMFAAPQTFTKRESSLYQFLLPKIGRRHKRILTVSEFSKKEIVKWSIAPEEKVTVIHIGGDHALKRPSDAKALEKWGLAAGKFVVGLANPRPQKNIKVVLEAMHSDEFTDTPLVLVGPNGPDEFKAYGLSVPPNVIFAGYVTDGEMRTLMEEALAFLCPSVLEGFGLPPLEAMFYGTPAICSPESSLPEACGTAAIYADAHDSSAWKAAILELMNDTPEQRANRATSVKQHASTMTWRHAGEKLVSVLMEDSK